MAKNGNWDADAMQGTLISDMEKEVKEGISQMQAATTPTTQPEGEQEPTKGVQTYIPLTQYQRLNNIKLYREKGTTIASLVAEAIKFWLDAQDSPKL